MAKISSYDSDGTIEAADKLIGTDGSAGVDSGKTKNYSVSALQTYLEGQLDLSKVDVVTITSTVFQTLTNAAPITLLAAPGAGKAYDVKGIVWYIDSGSTAFNTSADPKITGWLPSGNAATLDRATIINIANSKVLYKIEQGISGNGILQQNQPVQITANSGTTDAGNGTIYVQITYRIVNTIATLI
jgi:hypothetical protein